MNKFDLNNKNAIITGGAQGFGLDIAKRFLQSGAKVIIWDSDEKELKKASKLINDQNLSSDVVDISDPKNVDDSVNKITSKTKGMIINTPSNPTGGVWSKDAIKKSLKIASDNNITVISVSYTHLTLPTTPYV